MSAKNRVSKHTAPEINREICSKTQKKIKHCAENPQKISARLQELGSEWDIERILELNSSALTLVGLTLTIFYSIWWLILPFSVQAFLMQHAVRGWCPPLPIMRRLGFRTLDEINYERYALKVLRGDFDNITTNEEDSILLQNKTEEILHAVMH